MLKVLIPSRRRGRQLPVQEVPAEQLEPVREQGLERAQEPVPEQEPVREQPSVQRVQQQVSEPERELRASRFQRHISCR